MTQLLGEGHTAVPARLCVITECEGKVTNSSNFHDIDNGTVGHDKLISFHQQVSLRFVF